MPTSSRGISGPHPSIKFPVITRDEPKRKYPVTQKVMAVHIGQQLPCVTLAQTYYLDALHSSVSNLVYKLAVKYEPTCPRSEVQDMVQDCWVRIITKLHTYKPKWAFSTWIYQVSSSVLNKGYRRGRKHAQRFIEMPSGLDENRVSEDDSTDEAARSDFRDTIEQLKDIHPDKEKMIDAIFVDPEGDLNSDIVYRRAAESCGSTASKVSRFFRDEVRPFFIERFEGERCNE